MQECLKSICKDFEGTKGFLTGRTKEQEDLVERLFAEFMECFAEIHEEKLEYPKEFREDVKLYNQGDMRVGQKFEDVEMKYLMLSDFYDYARLTKKYTPERK